VQAVRPEWNCSVESFGDPGSLEYFVYRLVPSDSPKPHIPVTTECEEQRGIDLMHDHLDDEEFLKEISLWDD